ncbi:arsenic efflux protein [Pseudoalteromonas sp. MMG010]|uniref:putative manganese transporter n=1 Tax=Pseudoalteromonas sp. MMG010 TaxID=2822685 RepID=UPI001B39E387|nr:putative manganese transporter [Pseudoalteromonas sp. MMG010]MBQ4832451.1 arsenic efflux protein [Pseudoalteromonas sp. MMG010]
MTLSLAKPLFVSLNLVSQNKRLFLPLVVLVCLCLPSLQLHTITALSDAFFQVTVFVAVTLLLYYYVIDKFPQFELNYLRSKSPVLEVLFASVLGALPGCGGAIIVVTQFTKRQASFGAVTAVLAATMGDAAFLLLATKPKEGLLIMAIGLTVGTVTGWLVNLLHQNRFLIPEKVITQESTECTSPFLINLSKPLWKVTLIPSFIIAIAIAVNADFSLITKDADLIVSYFGAAMGIIVITVWAFSNKGQTYQDITSEDKKPSPPSKFIKVIQDTHFVSAWVVASFMLFEILINVVGLDLHHWFLENVYWAPLIALCIGLLPGCGPQIIVTTLYIQGYIPFSALAANAISNDGDALFPAIAMAPKAAIIATIYTAIPAFIIGYGLYFVGL